MTRAASLALVALGACASGGTTPAPQTVKLGPEIDKATAESDAKGLVDEVYSNLGRGKADNLIPLLAPPLVVFGPRKLDVAGNRADALVALGKVIDPKKAAQVISGSLAVMSGAGGRSAWAVDVIQVDGMPMAFTAVMSSNDDLWLLDAAAIARVPTKATLKAELKKESVVPPGMASGPKSDPRAAGAVDRFQKGLANQTQWGADLESRTMPVMIGPTTGEVARGKKDVKAMWGKRMKANVREIAVGDIVSAVTPDGQLAWVTAPITRAADDEEVTPLRVFAIYELSGGAWKLTALHESLAIAEPGAGAAFKKVAPPPPPPVEEKKPVEVAKTVDKPDKKEKKKKKVEKAVVAKDDPPPPVKKKKTKKPVDEEVVVSDDDPPPKKKKKKKPPVEEAPPPADDEPVVHKKKKHPKPTTDDDGGDDDVKVIDD